MQQNTELELASAQTHTVAAQPTVADMLQTVIRAGVTTENVGALEKLCDLYERMEARNAEKDFAAAFVSLQSELPTIVASTQIPNRGKYERFEDVMKVVQPLLAKHGFTVAFAQDYKDNRIIVTCHLTHVGGHSRTNPYAVRVNGKADTETQADCKASTTAKRNSLLQSLNIVIRQDCLSGEDDASLEGGAVTLEQAFELERRVKETNSNVNAFLKFAQAASFKDIPAGKYLILDDFLRQKERKGK